MRCTCGFENAAEARFCGQCGVVVGGPTAGTIPSATAPAVVPQVPVRAGKAGGRRASRALIALVALAAVAAAAGYWWLHRPPERYKPDNSGLYPIKLDGKYGFMDRSGKTVITPQFDETGGFSEGLAWVRIGTKVGYISTKGVVVITPQFDDARPFRYGRAAVKLCCGRWGKQEAGNRVGFIDTAGKYVGGLDFRGVGDFSGDLADVSTADGATAFVDRSGKIVLSGNFQSFGGVRTGFTAGLAPATPMSGGKWGFIDTTGKWAIDPQFDGVMNFADGLAPVVVGGRTGYIDRKGTFVVNPQYDYGWEFYEGYAFVGSGGKWGFIDTKGRMVGDTKFAAGGHFADGLAPVKTNDGWGYIDTTGKMIVSPQFDYAEAFQNGLARVTVAGKEAYVTTAGAFVVDPFPGRAGIPMHPVQEIWEGTVDPPAKTKDSLSFMLTREGTQIHGYYRPFIARPRLLSSVKGQTAQDGSFSMADESGTSWKGRFVSAVLITGVQVNPGEPSGKESPMRLRLVRDATIGEVNDAAVEKKDPANVSSRVQLADAYFDAGRYAEAAGLYEGALALDPKDVNVSTDLAISYYYTNQTDRAISQMAVSLSIDPKHTKTWLNLGVVKAFGKQDLTGATAAWDEVIKLAPGSQEAQSARRALDNLKTARPSGAKPPAEAAGPPTRAVSQWQVASYVILRDQQSFAGLQRVAINAFPTGRIILARLGAYDCLLLVEGMNSPLTRIEPELPGTSKLLGRGSAWVEDWNGLPPAGQYTEITTSPFDLSDSNRVSDTHRRLSAGSSPVGLIRLGGPAIPGGIRLGIFSEGHLEDELLRQTFGTYMRIAQHPYELIR